MHRIISKNRINNPVFFDLGLIQNEWIAMLYVNGDAYFSKVPYIEGEEGNTLALRRYSADINVFGAYGFEIIC